MKTARAIIWGLAIVAAGVIFGGNALGIFNIDIFFKGWWTLFIIIPSAISLITEKEKVSNLVFLSAGVIFLLASQEVFSFDVAWKAILAVALIAFGLSLIVKSIFKGKTAKEVDEKIKKMKNEENDTQVAIFSGSDRVYNNEKFSSSELVAIFGGANLDIRKAVIQKDVCIKAFCLFGGIDIVVPKDVEIKSKSGFLFGGISDDRKDTAKSPKHTIYLDAGGGFGGISIKDESDK